MKKNEIKVGGVYIAKVSNRLTPVRVDAIREGSYARGGKHAIYDVTNLTTGRKTTFRSAAKFRGEAKPDAAATKPKPKVDSGQFGARDRDAEEAGFVSPLTDADIERAEKAIAAAEGEQRSDPTASAMPLTTSTSSTNSKNNAAKTTANAPGCTGPSTPSFAGLAAALAAEATPADDSPHLIVQARAGTGKTTTLIEALRLLQGGSSKLTPSPQQQAVWDAVCLSKGKVRSVGFVAFNRSIAEELKTRVPAGVEAMTMHSLGFRAVRRAFPKLQVSDWAVKDLIAEAAGMDFRDLAREKPTLLNAVNELVSLCKVNLAEPTPDGLDRLSSRYDVDTNGCRDEAYAMTPQVLARCADPASTGRICFDDMIWLPVRLNLPITPYDLLMVDEAQDLNRCQQALAKKAGRRLILVGDDRQAIYGFAGADADSLPRMTQELSSDCPRCGTSGGAANSKCKECGEQLDWTKGRGCVTLPLTVTRRCGKAIVAEAAKLVPDFTAHDGNGEGQISELLIETNERKLTGDLAAKNYQPAVKDGDFVLCRKNAPLVRECFRFLKAGRRANIQGRDIGAGLAAIIKKLCKDKQQAPVTVLIAALTDWLAREQAKERAKRMPSETKLQTIEDRHDCILMFAGDAKLVSDVLAKIEGVFTDDKTSPGIKLSSIHKSKGLEARRVFFLDHAEAQMPLHKMQAWERGQETNLRYVAITRAIEELIYVR